jgi:hypothetical protein
VIWESLEFSGTDLQNGSVRILLLQLPGNRGTLEIFRGRVIVQHLAFLLDSTFTPDKLFSFGGERFYEGKIQSFNPQIIWAVSLAG